MVHRLIIDTSVIMKTQTVEETYYRLPERLRLGFLKAIIEYVASGVYLDGIDEVVPTFVFDWKNEDRKYWRHYKYEEWLDTLESKGKFVLVPLGDKMVRRKRVPYKYGRKFPSATYAKYAKDFRKVLGDTGFPILGSKGYEADDIAGSLVNRMPEEDTATLVTIDSDWLGLVSDRVDFYNIINYQPSNRWRITLEDVINTNACRDYAHLMNKPSDIWKVKSIYGDSSDRLLPGTPLGLISLLEPTLTPLGCTFTGETTCSKGNEASDYLDKLNFRSFR